VKRNGSSCCSYVIALDVHQPSYTADAGVTVGGRVPSALLHLFPRSFQAGFDWCSAEGLEYEGDPSHSGYDGYVKGSLLESSGGTRMLSQQCGRGAACCSSVWFFCRQPCWGEQCERKRQLKAHVMEMQVKRLWGQRGTEEEAPNTNEFLDES